MGTRSSTRRALGIATAVTLALATVGVGATGAGAAAAPPTAVNIVVGDTAGTKAPMTMTVDPVSAPAGKVKFTVTNNGTVIHEMVVVKLKGTTTYDQIPIKSNRISEAGAVGEIGNIGKGKTKSVTLKLKAGNYALVCNIAKHYGLGMRAAFTVT